MRSLIGEDSNWKVIGCVRCRGKRARLSRKWKVRQIEETEETVDSRHWNSYRIGAMILQPYVSLTNPRRPISLSISWFNVSQEFPLQINVFIFHSENARPYEIRIVLYVQTLKFKGRPFDRECWSGLAGCWKSGTPRYERRARVSVPLSRDAERGEAREREKKNTRKESRLVEEGARKWSTARVKMHHTATNQEHGRSMISLRNLLRSFYNTALIVSVRWKPITDNCTLCTDLAFFLR